MRIAVITCLNDRPDISRILLSRREIYGPFLYAGVSSSQDVDVVEEYAKCVPVCTDGKTAGDRWNDVLNSALSATESTHFLIMGDDDTISVEGVNLLIKAAQSGASYCGFKKNYFFDTLTGEGHSHEQKFMANKLCGAGRLISRAAIEAACDLKEIQLHKGIDTPWKSYTPGKHIVTRAVAEYLSGYKGFASITGGRWHNLWPSKGNGLDHASEMRLVFAGHPPVALDDDKIHITDFKSAKNIWSYESVKEKFPGPKVSFEEATWFMSDFEKGYVKSLIER